jgi:hypothetical protein
MLDAFIIEQLKRERERERQRHAPVPLELPRLPTPLLPPEESEAPTETPPPEGDPIIVEL